MHRSPVQGAPSLEEYFREIARGPNPIDQLVGQQMLRLLELLNNLFPHLTIWGMTSMARLGLSPDPCFTNSWPVLISGALLPGAYRIEYLLPVGKRPWEHAFVQGESQSLAETTRYLLLAMRESEAWAGNTEFEAVLAQHGLTVA